MTIRTHERLKCPHCPGSRFTRVISISYHHDHGVQEKNDGLRCVDCLADVDLNHMLDMHKYRKELEEVDARKRELESQYAGVKSKGGHDAVPVKGPDAIPIREGAGSRQDMGGKGRDPDASARTQKSA